MRYKYSKIWSLTQNEDDVSYSKDTRTINTWVYKICIFLVQINAKYCL